jgi:hypothetical protein
VTVKIHEHDIDPMFSDDLPPVDCTW